MQKHEIMNIISSVEQHQAIYDAKERRELGVLVALPELAQAFEDAWETAKGDGVRFGIGLDSSMKGTRFIKMVYKDNQSGTDFIVIESGKIICINDESGCLQITLYNGMAELEEDEILCQTSFPDVPSGEGYEHTGGING